MPAQFNRVYLLGPTCTGKTELAVTAATKWGGEIISCDSVQVYRGLNIGTAKPSREQRDKVAHHLIDCVDLGGNFTAADFRHRALNIIDDRSRQGIPRFYIVGGSGFYVSALERGMFDLTPVPEQIRIDLKNRLAREGLEALYMELLSVDSDYAKSIEPQDTYRVIRGLEIWQHEGRKLSQIQREFHSQSVSDTSPKIGLWLERPLLLERVQERTARMIKNGLIDEVQGLLVQGFADWPPLASVGYRETCAFLRGEIKSVDELEEQIVVSTMQLAKRQKTWFKRDPQIRWFDVAQGLAEPLACLAAL